MNGRDKGTALIIVLSSRERYILSKERKKNVNSLKELVREELVSLNNYTDVPERIVWLVKEKINNRYLII